MKGHYKLHNHHPHKEKQRVGLAILAQLPQLSLLLLLYFPHMKYGIRRRTDDCISILEHSVILI